MGSTMYRIGQAMANILTSSFIINGIMIVQDNFRNDGLLEGLTSYHKSHGLRIELSLKLIVSHSDSLITLSSTIINIWKYQDLVVIFHCESELIEKILKLLNENDPDLWESKLMLFSPMIFQNRSHIPSRVPIGALALDVEQYDVHMFVNRSICAIEEHIQNCSSTSSIFSNVNASNQHNSR